MEERKVDRLEEIKSQMLEQARQAGSASRPSFGQDVLKLTKEGDSIHSTRLETIEQILK